MCGAGIGRGGHLSMTDKGHALFLQVRAFGDKGP